MREALADVTTKASVAAKLVRGDMVVDTGCNDGTLLRTYPVSGIRLVGFEPAQNLVEDARKGTDCIFNDFFQADIFLDEFGHQKAKIITSVAMFYDLEDPNTFVSDIVEFFAVETNDVNGGSFRIYACHRGKYAIEESVAKLRRKEERLQLNVGEAYRTFAKSIRRIKSDLVGLVRNEVKGGKRVYVYGASNRGNTILQYCGLDYRLIMKAADANSEKWGRRTVGTKIPIVSKEEARKDKPDYFLILPHHFLEEIRREEKDYLQDGGKFIVPLPEVRVLA